MWLLLVHGNRGARAFLFGFARDSLQACDHLFSRKSHSR